MQNDRVLLLDVMDTLVEDPFFTRLPAYFGEPIEQLAKSMSYETWCAFERGEIDEAKYAQNAFIDGRAFDVEALKRMMVEGYRLFDGVEALLQELHGRGVRIFAMSNYPPWYQMIDEKLQLSRFLSWETVSCKTGLRKPELRAYNNAARIAGVSAERCLFVDDRASNVEAAKEAGMSAFLTTKSTLALRQAIEEFLL